MTDEQTNTTRPAQAAAATDSGRAAGVSTEPPILHIRDLTFDYHDGVRALEAVRLTVQAGESVAVVGANGSGKSTLLLHAAALMPSDRVLVAGMSCADRRHVSSIRRLVGILFQEPDDQLFMPTVAEDVAFGPVHFGLSPEEADRRARRVLDALDLAHLADRPSHHLSGGEKRLVALATVLAHEPRLLVLDEPTAGLDPRARRLLMERLRSLQGDGATILLATHDLDMAHELCPRTVVLAHGRVLADGPTKRLLADEALMARAGLEVCLSVRLEQALSGRPDRP